jgi:hypothetical protein
MFKDNVTTLKVAYYDEFNKEKIIWTEMTSTPSFLIDDKNFVLLNSSYMMVSENDNYNLRYLLNLNSNLLFWVFKQISPKLYGKRLRFIRQYVEKLPSILQQ